MSEIPKEKEKSEKEKGENHEVVESPDFDVTTESLDCCDVDGCDTGGATTTG